MAVRAAILWLAVCVCDLMNKVRMCGISVNCITTFFFCSPMGQGQTQLHPEELKGQKYFCWLGHRDVSISSCPSVHQRFLSLPQFLHVFHSTSQSVKQRLLPNEPSVAKEVMGWSEELHNWLMIQNTFLIGKYRCVSLPHTYTLSVCHLLHTWAGTYWV